MDADDDEIAGDVVMGDAAFIESSPIPADAYTSKAMQAAALFSGAPPTSITPSTATATLTHDTPTLASLYHLSRRSRSSSSSERVMCQLPESHANIPPPPLYSVSGCQHQNQPSNRESFLTSFSRTNEVSISSTFNDSFSANGAYRDSWNTSMSSLMNSSFFNASNNIAFATNPPIGNNSSKLKRPREAKNNLKDIWSKLNNYSMVETNAQQPSSTSSNLSPLDDSESSQVRRDFEMHVNCHQDNAIPGADGCNTRLDMPPPPHKKNRKGCLRIVPEGSRYEPTSKQSSFKSNASFDFVSDNAHTLTPLHVHDSRSRDQEDSHSSPNSIQLEDLEDPPSPDIVQAYNEKDQKLVRRKIQRLLLIRHCTQCSKPFSNSAPGYFCPVTSHCAEGKALCAHIKTCKLDDCTYEKCLTSREVLGHYMKCKDLGCMVCGPVRSRDKERNQKNDDDSIETIDDFEWLKANML